MKNPLTWLLTLIIIAFTIAGFVFLNTATSSSSYTENAVRTPALISGLTLISIATVLLVFGLFFTRPPRPPQS